MAIVGPHGSALLNMHWAAPGALVLEVFAAGQRGNEE
jgi:capsular polysaccharide biosynthesis protein